MQTWYYLFDLAAHDLFGYFREPIFAHAFAQEHGIGAYSIMTGAQVNADPFVRTLRLHYVEAR